MAEVDLEKEGEGEEVTVTVADGDDVGDVENEGVNVGVTEGLVVVLVDGDVL